LNNPATKNFHTLGGVFLSVTGLEALYADLGHFGAGPIRLSWLSFVFPSLVLNYLGQGAALLRDPTQYTNIFYHSVPGPFYWPMIVLSTLATVIASQALITGCSSLVSQAIQLGLCPPLTIIHTSHEVAGQIYIPEITYLLMIMTIAIVPGFQHSASIASAYGVTVSGGSLCTTILVTAVMLHNWKLAWWKVIPFAIVFMSIDIAFFISNLVKIASGGWVPILFGLLFSLLMISWKVGEFRVKDFFKHQGLVTISGIKEHLEKDNTKLPYAGVFISNFKQRAPPSFISFSRCIYALPSTIIFLNVETAKVPFVPREKRLKQVKNYGDGIYRIVASTGFIETEVEVLDILTLARSQKLIPKFTRKRVSFFLNHEQIYVDTRAPHRLILYTIYSALKKQFGRRSNLLMPVNRIIEVGLQVQL